LEPVAVAEDDSASTGKGKPVTIAVLANDGGSGLTSSSVTSPTAQGGTATVNGDGKTVVYTPKAGFSGTDTFEYTAVAPGGESDKATVTVTVRNHAPVASDIVDQFITDQGATLTIGAPGVLYNDSDEDGDPLEATKLTGASHGDVTLDADGSFTYVPQGDFSGSDSFTYKNSDGEAESSPATVTIAVKEFVPPVALTDGFVAYAQEELAVAKPGVLQNDNGGTGDSLQAVKVGDPAHAASFRLGADGAFAYTPATGFSGSDSFTYKAKNGQSESDTVSVAINVLPVASDDRATTPTGTAKAIAVLANDIGTGLTLSSATTPGHGTATVNSNGTVEYTPAAGFSGPDSFHYAAKDAAGKSATATVTVDVAPPNPSTGGTVEVVVPPVVVLPPVAPATVGPAPPTNGVAGAIAAHVTSGGLRSCTVRLVGQDRGGALLARGVARNVGNRTTLRIEPRLFASGQRYLAKRFGGATVAVQVQCVTTANGVRNVTKQTRAVLRFEHRVTPPGSWATGTARLTPVGKRYVVKLRRRLIEVSRIRCDGYDATYRHRHGNPVGVARTTALVKLSIARATVVCSRLRPGRTVTKRIVGHGRTDPIATNATERGRRINRRVEITVLHRPTADL